MRSCIAHKTAECEVDPHAPLHPAGKGNTYRRCNGSTKRSSTYLRPCSFLFQQTLTAKFLSTISLVHHLQAAYRISCITELSISVIASGTEKTKKFYVIVNAHEDGSKRKDRIEPIQ